MTTVPLAETISIALDANGNGTAQIGPLTAREIWHPANVHVSVTTAVNEAVCTIYVGDAAQQRCFRDATFTGSSGDSSDRVSADTVRTGAYVWASWAGGDALAQATLTVTGTRDV
jgi:hypothetical protein